MKRIFIPNKKYFLVLNIISKKIKYIKVFFKNKIYKNDITDEYLFLDKNYKKYHVKINDVKYIFENKDEVYNFIIKSLDEEIKYYENKNKKDVSEQVISLFKYIIILIGIGIFILFL